MVFSNIVNIFCNKHVRVSKPNTHISCLGKPSAPCGANGPRQICCMKHCCIVWIDLKYQSSSRQLQQY